MRPDANPAPAPLVLADMLAIHAWSPHIDADTRTLCGWAADSLRRVAREAARQTAQREVSEAESEMYRRIAYGSQKGGAA